MSLRQPDELYAALMAQQAGMSEAESLRYCARLILLLANEVGEDARVLAMLAEAGQAARPGS